MLAGVVAAVAVLGSSFPERLIYDFPSNWLRGGLPAAGLIAGDRGAMYGSTVFGGTGACNDIYPGCGTVFELAPARGGFKQTVVYDFQRNGDGAGPAELVRDRSGVLYGITSTRPHLLFRLIPSLSRYLEST
ncbi:MAG: hypothetical protein JO060_01560, partial [Candidatus Eremiobacteraeota bacterium]|nr:hypothetical protein [Candidatus Eremiobacteraeota bacterium]